MKVTALPVDGALEIEIEPLRDERGFFARTWCAEELAPHGVVPTIAQQSVSFNERAGTLRGMHWQAEPHGEDKLVRCTSGRAFDVILDVRPDSPTYRRTATLVLDARAHNAVWIPRGIAHGFMTLEDDTEILYQMSTAYVADAQRGLRWDDPGLDVDWPRAPAVISTRDSSYAEHAW